jgi:hypothetical protein
MMESSTNTDGWLFGSSEQDRSDRSIYLAERLYFDFNSESRSDIVFGREYEVQKLEETFATSLGKAVFLVGPLGAGKTSVLKKYLQINYHHRCFRLNLRRINLLSPHEAAEILIKLNYRHLQEMAETTAQNCRVIVFIESLESTMSGQFCLPLLVLLEQIRTPWNRVYFVFEASQESYNYVMDNVGHFGRVSVRDCTGHVNISPPDHGTLLACVTERMSSEYFREVNFDDRIAELVCDIAMRDFAENPMRYSRLILDIAHQRKKSDAYNHPSALLGSLLSFLQRMKKSAQEECDSDSKDGPNEALVSLIGLCDEAVQYTLELKEILQGRDLEQRRLNLHDALPKLVNLIKKWESYDWRYSFLKDLFNAICDYEKYLDAWMLSAKTADLEAYFSRITRVDIERAAESLRKTKA